METYGNPGGANRSTKFPISILDTRQHHPGGINLAEFPWVSGHSEISHTLDLLSLKLR